MNKENRPLVTDDRLSLRNNQLKSKTSGKLPIIVSRGIYGMYLKSMKKSQKITTCNWLDLEKL